MLRAVRAKFAQREDLAALLLSSGDALIVERSPHDRYWGAGADGLGANKLGQIFMAVRAELRS